MLSAEFATVMALRCDVAHHIARRAKHLGANQVAAARHLGIPQPTLSKIMNGRVADLSLELLIRIAVLAGLPLTLQTGQVPEEAGAFISGSASRASRTRTSALSDVARHSLARSARGLTPTQRLEAFVEHNQLLAELHAAGRQAAERTRHVQPK